MVNGSIFGGFNFFLIPAVDREFEESDKRPLSNAGDDSLHHCRQEVRDGEIHWWLLVSGRLGEQICVFGAPLMSAAAAAQKDTVQ